MSLLRAIRKTNTGSEEGSPSPVFADPNGNLLGVSPPVSCASADVHAPAAATAAVVTYTAVADKKHVITGVAWSYSATPTGGNLQIEDVAGTVVFSVDISAGGPGVIVFPHPKRSAAVNTAMIVTLASGAGTVVGKANVTNHWSE